MSTEKLELIATAKDEASKVLSGLQTKLKGFGVDLGAVTKVGLGAVGAGVALGEAMKGVGEFLGQAAVAAINEQENIAKLDAALRANVQGWDGNAAAIETAIKRREDLAFSDDDLRNSLATLVTSLHSVDSAMDAQSLAMDIARGRGISLNDASILVAKTMQGDYRRAFKAAGLSLDGIKDKTQALAALQQQYAGQAAAYAQTTKGQFEALGIAVQDADESLGQHLLPSVNKLAAAGKNDLVPMLNQAADAAGSLMDLLFGPPPGPSTLDDVADRAHMTAKLLRDLNIAAAGGLDKLSTNIRAQEPQITAASIYAMHGLREHMAEIVADAHKTGVNIGDRLHDGIVSGKSEVKDAMAALTFAIKHPLEDTEYVAWLEGQLTGKKLKQGLASQDDSVRQQAKETQQIILDEIARVTGRAYGIGVRAMHALNNGLASVNVHGPRVMGGGGVQRRASGGPTEPNVPYLVGENGPELRTFSRSGYIVPNGGGMRPVIVNVNGRELFRIMDEEMGRQLSTTSPYSYVRG